MHSPFERLDPETREAWRNTTATEAFLRTLAQHRATLVEAIVLACDSDGDLNRSLHRAGGEVRAIEFVERLARFDGRENVPVPPPVREPDPVPTREGRKTP